MHDAPGADPPPDPRGVPAILAVDACLFDLDGVLTDTTELHTRAWTHTLDRFLEQEAVRTGRSLPRFDPDDDYRRYVDGKRRRDGVRSFLESRGIVLPEGDDDDPPGIRTVASLARAKDAAFHQALSRGVVEPFPDAVELLQAIALHRVRGRGPRCAVVSSSANAREVLTVADIATWFALVVDGVVAREHDLPGKPEPDTFLFAAEQLGTPPSRVAVLEDALAGVEAARRGGFGLVVGVDRTGHGPELLRRGAHVVVDDLSLLLDPDAVALGGGGAR